MTEFLASYVYYADTQEEADEFVRRCDAEHDAGQAEYDARTEIAHFDTRMAARTKELKKLWQWALRVPSEEAPAQKEVSQ